LREVSVIAAQHDGSFDGLVREFMDEFYMHEAEMRDSIQEVPISLDPIKDAYLAALAEHLATQYGLEYPAWASGSERFLHEPFFASGLESLKAILLVESPAAFRRRMIFIDKDALTSPRMSFREVTRSGLDMPGRMSRQAAGRRGYSA
jgi:hypothetical protein